MIGKSLICGMAGVTVVGAFHLIGADFVASVVVALFVVIVVATVVLNGRSKGGTETEPEHFNIRSSVSGRAGDPD